LWGLSFAHLILLLQHSPYAERKEAIINLVQESVFVLIYILIFLFVYDHRHPYMNAHDKRLAGWISIGLCSIILLTNLLCIFYDLAILIQNILEFLKKKFWNAPPKEKSTPHTTDTQRVVAQSPAKIPSVKVRPDIVTPSTTNQSKPVSQEIKSTAREGDIISSRNSQRTLLPHLESLRTFAKSGPISSRSGTKSINRRAGRIRLPEPNQNKKVYVD